MQKQHHTVPRCYLENFVNKDNKIWVLNNEDKIFPTAPEKILREKHFYRITLRDGTKSLVIENTLSEIEGVYAEIFRDKISKEKRLTETEKANVAVFIAAMMHRTGPSRDEMRSVFQKLKEWGQEKVTEKESRILDSTPTSNKSSVSFQELEEGLENFDEHHASGLIDQTIKTAQYLFNMKWAILKRENTGNVFVTSDSPFVMDRPAAIKKYGRGTFGSRAGLKHKDVEITLPLSSNQILLAGWILNEETYGFVPADVIEGFNQRTILAASKQLLGSDNIYLEKIRNSYPSKKKL